MISVLILTLNEERNLPACLESVRWSDDIVVFDSFSTDKTVEIAKAAGARVIQRKFDNEREHRTASLKIEFKYPWVYNPDADEIASPALCDEMRKVVADAARKEVAYRVRFKNMFMGRWLKHSALYPNWCVRLFRPERIGFEREINLRYVADGPIGELKEHFAHYSFNNGMAAWFEKHNRYTDKEAMAAFRSRTGEPLAWRDILSSDPVRRRKFLREASYRLPFRPTLRFAYMYFWRMGFLDGTPGYHFCRLMAMYEYMIVLKTRELEQQKKQ